MELKKQNYSNGGWGVVLTIAGASTLTLRVRTEQSADTIIRTLGEHVIDAEATATTKTPSGLVPRVK